MVATTRSKSKASSSSSDIDMNPVMDTIRRKRVARGRVARSNLFEIPELLFGVIEDAAFTRKSLRKNPNDRDLERSLYAKEERINLLAMYYKWNDELPESWEYDHRTALLTHVPKPSTPPKEKSKRKMEMFPTVNGIPLNEEEKKVWMNFKTKDKSVKGHHFISYPMKKDLIRVDETDPIVGLIAGFAVEAFNDSYHKYVDEHGSKNITQAVPVDCKYYKLTSKYNFYVTIEAIEQGKPGVYEAAIECDCVNGARTLNKFALTNKSEHTQYEEGEVSEYDKAWSSDSSDPEDFYKISGMVRRRQTRGGGFDYHNPSSNRHMYILNDGRKNRYRKGKV